MDMSGDRLIAASRERVWEALNDPEILKACIPGCESITKLSDTELTAVVAVKLGPIAARFNGKVSLTDLDPPAGYKINGEGQGGVAGFAKGGAEVALAEEGEATRLAYKVNAQIGGKMAQLGARLIDSTAKSYAETFFTRFSELVAPPAPVAPVVVAESPLHIAHEDHDHDASNPHYFGLPLGVIIAGIVAVISVAATIAKFIFFYK